MARREAMPARAPFVNPRALAFGSAEEPLVADLRPARLRLVRASLEEVSDTDHEQRAEGRHGNLEAVRERGADLAFEPGVGDQHLAGDPAEEPGAEPDEDREP